mgnify:CR=1 FL=1
MKSFNKYISILNIINIILVVVIYIIQDFIIYETAKEILLLMYYIIAGFNIILAIVNLVKRNRKIGSIQILTGIIMLAGTMIASYESSILMQCFVSIIIFILSIINLIFNKRLMTTKKGKAGCIIFVIILIFELAIVIIPVILNIMNLKNLENAISKILQDGKEETYIYSKDNKNIIIGEDGKKISENEDDISYYPIQLQIENQTINLRYAVDNENKLYMIDSKGEKLFEIYNLFDDNEKIISNFFSLVVGNNIFNITNPTNEIGYQEYIDKTKALKTYTGDIDMSEFEEEENVEYKYFSSEEISDKILQVVIKKDEKETDSELSNNYLESNIIAMSDYSYNQYDALTTELEDFYNYKKEYYLLDINSNNKIQLECNNLLYRIYYNENKELQEDILIYSNGYIPYYDSDNSGYFDENGQKTRISNKYLIQEMTDNYQIIINKSTAKSYIYNRQNGKIEKEYEYFKVYNNFYVSYNSENDEYEIINKNNLEVMAKSKEEPQIYKDSIIICSEENQDKCYYYNGEGLELVDDCINFASFEKNVYSTNYLLSGIDDSVYAKMGIIYEDDR